MQFSLFNRRHHCRQAPLLLSIQRCHLIPVFAILCYFLVALFLLLLWFSNLAQGLWATTLRRLLQQTRGPCILHQRVVLSSLNFCISPVLLLPLLSVAVIHASTKSDQE